MGVKRIGILTDSVNSVFVREAMQGFERALQGKDASLELFELHELDEVSKNREIERLALEKAADAFVLAHLPFNYRQAALFHDQKIPLGYLAGRLEGVDWVMVDEVQGAYDAARHLLAMGHRRIAMVSGPPVALESRLREDGFLRALKEEGLSAGREAQVKILNFTEDEGYEAGHLLTRLPEPPSAVFVAAGDLTALGVISALHEHGLSIPRDISVVGYDDLAFAGHLDPPLTTVRQPLADMGAQLMVRMLEALKEGPAHRCGGELVAATLMVRQSTGRPAKTAALKA